LTTLRGVRVLPKIVGVFGAWSVVFAPHASADAVVSPVKIETLLLSDDEVSTIIGLPLHRVGKAFPAPAPPGPPGEHSECRVFTESDAGKWTGEFTAYRQIQQEDNPDNLQFADQQMIAVYPKAQTAAQTFQKAFPSDLGNRCGPVAMPDADSHVQWKMDGIAITGSGSRWMSIELYDGQDIMWHCANEVRLKSNVMYQDQVCQYGNGSSLATQMADMTASRFP